jgi:hypothetical protein
MNKKELYKTVIGAIAELQKEKLMKAIDEVTDLIKARGEEKQRRQALASKAHGKKFNAANNWGLDDPKRGHEFGINPQSKRHAPGVSVAGGHLRDKSDPVIPLKEQHKDHLRHLKEAPKANLPKSEDMKKDSVILGKPLTSEGGNIASGKQRIHNEKGVHPAVSRVLQHASVMGLHQRSGNKDTAQDMAVSKLKELQHMPKPNLPKSEPVEKKYEGFKAVEEHAKESGARDPGAVAAAVGREKYGKEAFQHAAAAGKKMGKTEPLGKPYVSDAQRKKFHAMENRGEISHATVHEWDEASKGKKLPEHVAKADPNTDLPGVLISKASSAPAPAPMPPHPVQTPKMKQLKQPTMKMPPQRPAELAHSEPMKKDGMSTIRQPNPGENSGGLSTIRQPTQADNNLGGIKPMPTPTPAPVQKDDSGMMSAPALMVSEQKHKPFKDYMQKCMLNKCWTMKAEPHSGPSPYAPAPSDNGHGKDLNQEIAEVKAKENSKEMKDSSKTLNYQEKGK